MRHVDCQTSESEPSVCMRVLADALAVHHAVFCLCSWFSIRREKKKYDSCFFCLFVFFWRRRSPFSSSNSLRDWLQNASKRQKLAMQLDKLTTESLVCMTEVAGLRRCLLLEFYIFPELRNLLTRIRQTSCNRKLQLYFVEIVEILFLFCEKL